MNSVRESLGNAITELGTGLAASQETLLAARIAEVVVSRLLLQVSTVRQYVREREAAEYMGVKVAICVRGDCFVLRMGLPSPASGGWSCIRWRHWRSTCERGWFRIETDFARHLESALLAMFRQIGCGLPKYNKRKDRIANRKDRDSS